MIKKKGISILLVVAMVLSMCATSLTALAAQPKSVETATLTIYYYMEGSGGNMIHEPYIAQQVVGSTYSVESPEIENFRLKDNSQQTIAGTLTQDTKVFVYYTYETQTFPYTIIYQGYDKSNNTTIMLDTVTKYAPADTKVPVEYREFFGYDKESVDDMSLIVTADGNATKTLTYTLKDDIYIIFRTQGSYVAPITADVGTDISNQIRAIEKPTRPGYTFAGWEYNGQVYETANSLAAALSTMPLMLTYVNAVWEPGVANYTVLTWFENADDDGYTLYSNVQVRSGMIGALVTATPSDIAMGDNDENEANNPYFGFNYARCEDTVIAADGTAVLNLYYDREIWKINFMEEAKNDETVWKTIEGKYMSLIGDKLPTQEELKEHYGPGFAYMAKTEGGNDSAMLEKFENSKSGTDKYGEQNIYPYFNSNLYQFQIRHFSYDPNADTQDQILIQTSYIYYYKSYAPGMMLIPPEGFTWSGGWWKTASTEAGLEYAGVKKNPDSNRQDELVTFWNVYQYMDVYMQRDKSLLKYISNGETIQQIQNVPYEKKLDLSLVPTNGEEHMQFEGWYTNPNLMDFMEPLSEYQMPASDLNLYAKWGPVDYTVTFDTRGGSEIPQQTVKYNTSAAEPEQPTRPGYTFTGWYTQPVGGNIWSFEQTISGDVTLYAHWRESVTAPFTINHVIQGETQPFYQQKGISTIGDTIYAAALSAEDGLYPENVYLEPQEAGSKTIVIQDNQDNSVTFVYHKIGAKNYTALYQEEGTGMQLAPSKKVEGTLNSIVTELPKEITGYTCTSQSGYQTVSLSVDQENTIVFQYQRNEDPIPDQVSIYPEDQTIYTGGESGDTNNVEFPRPIYLLQETDGTTSELGDTKFILDGDSSQSYTAEQLFEVKYYNEDGLAITSDQTYGDFAARIVLQDAYQSAFVTTEDGEPVRFQDGTLRIRYVSSFTEASQNLLTTQALKYSSEDEKAEKAAQVENTGKAGVLLPKDTTIYLNGKTQYAYPDSATGHIALFFDELLPEQAGGDNATYTNMLITHAASNGYTVDSQSSQFRYLDLVDTYDSNAWVSSSAGSDVFWPYPAGTDKNTEFQLLHFTGLHREYRMNGVSLADQVKNSEIEVVEYTKANTGIWFHIGESGFSPFALVWENDSGSSTPDPKPDPKPEPKPDPDDTGVSDWLDTQNHRLYLVGYPDITFRPERNMTRAEVAQMFYALLLDQDVEITTSFSDVPEDAWYTTAVNTLASLGMLNGYPDGTFRPDAPITRAEFTAVALAFAYEPEEMDCSYYDVFYETWYYPYVAQGTSYDWISGYPDGTFRPQNYITRAEVSIIVNNMLGRVADYNYIDKNPDKIVHFVDLEDVHWAYYSIMESTNTHEYERKNQKEIWKILWKS